MRAAAIWTLFGLSLAVTVQARNIEINIQNSIVNFGDSVLKDDDDSSIDVDWTPIQPGLAIDENHDRLPPMDGDPDEWFGNDKFDDMEVDPLFDEWMDKWQLNANSSYEDIQKFIDAWLSHNSSMLNNTTLTSSRFNTTRLNSTTLINSRLNTTGLNSTKPNSTILHTTGGSLPLWRLPLHRVKPIGEPIEKPMDGNPKYWVPGGRGFPSWRMPLNRVKPTGEPIEKPMDGNPKYWVGVGNVPKRPIIPMGRPDEEPKDKDDLRNWALGGEWRLSPKERHGQHWWEEEARQTMSRERSTTRRPFTTRKEITGKPGSTGSTPTPPLPTAYRRTTTKTSTRSKTTPPPTTTHRRTSPKTYTSKTTPPPTTTHKTITAKTYTRSKTTPPPTTTHKTITAKTYTRSKTTPPPTTTHKRTTTSQMKTTTNGKTTTKKHMIIPAIKLIPSKSIDAKQ